MLVGANDCGVKHQTFQVRILPGLQKASPYAALGPAVESLEDGVPLSETLRKIPPRGAGPSDPKDRVDETAIVLRRPSRIARLTR